MIARALSMVERALASTRRVSFVALWVVLIAQVVWTAFAIFHQHTRPSDLLYPLVFVPAAALLAATGGRVGWIAVVPRLLIAFGFLENVADRLGFLGPPGAPNVSWGDFHHFIAYTAQVNAFAPAAIIPTLAVLATIGESTCGLLMLVGYRVRLAAAASAALLTVFGTAMVASGLSEAQYNVYLMAVCAWALAATGSSTLSVDAVRAASLRPPGREMEERSPLLERP